jgi:hypothetical protein
MKLIFASGLGLCLMLSHLNAQASAPIAPFRATYTSEWNDLISVTAQATQELKVGSDGKYEFSFVVNHALLKLNENSTFTWPSSQIVPSEYHYRQITMGFERKKEALFDWTKNTASNPDTKKPWTVSVAPNTLDRLSYQLQLRADIKAGKKDLAYVLVDNGKLKTYKFNVLGSEIIKTPFGAIDTVKVERVLKPGDDRQTTFWLAKQWDYLLVKFKQTENGKLYEINLSEATVNGKSIK